MRIDEAMAIFGFSEVASQAEIKSRYRDLALRYHPDRNPAGAPMMKAVNAAYEHLQKAGSTVHRRDQSAGNYGADLEVALTAIIHLSGLAIEVCGAWIWVGGETKPHRQTLKEAGFFWAPKKGLWYYRPKTSSSRSRGRFSMNEIRDKFGSDAIAQRSNRRLDQEADHGS